MKLNYYGKLNENEICTEIVSTKKDLKGIRGFIEIPDYNESILYRKWVGDQWSQEKYEPSLEVKLQEKLKELEEQNINKDKQIEELKESLQIISDAFEEYVASEEESEVK